jgi:hypothetical protein
VWRDKFGTFTDEEDEKCQKLIETGNINQGGPLAKLMEIIASLREEARLGLFQVKKYCEALRLAETENLWPTEKMQIYVIIGPEFSN